jgi:N-acetylneuraminic acid mutarotase
MKKLSRTLILGLVLLFVFSSFSSRSAESQSDPTSWSLRAPLPVPNSETGVAATDGKIYVIGGYPSDRKTVATVQVYDARTDKWQILAPLPQPLNHVIAAAINGKIYVMGGQTSEISEPEKAGFVNTVYEYDPGQNKWTTRASMPTSRSGGAAAVVDDKIYVAGGRPPHGHDFAVYDPKSDIWTQLANLPTQRNHLAAGAYEDKVYVVGGRFGGGFQSERTAAVEVYDPKTRQWTKRAPMLKPRGGVNGIFANGCFHLFGGEGNPDHPYHVFPDHDYYNPVTNTWHRLDPMPIAVHGVTGLAFINGYIHLPGGGTAQGGSSGSSIHQVYQPKMTCNK